MASRSFEPQMMESLKSRVTQANQAFLRSHPGEPESRQPVHTVYGGGHLFKSDTATKLGEVARKVFSEHVPNAKTLSRIFKLEGALGAKVYDRVQTKLATEAVEDFRIDFEDGYGNRSTSEEDNHAEAAAKEVAKGFREKTLSPFIGIRVKCLSDELIERSLSTLDIFLTTMLTETKGVLPNHFVVTLPKITAIEQVSTFAQALEALESRLKLPLQSLKLELMVETPQSIFAPDGTVALPKMIKAAAGRCRGLHFGTYDYTASNQITASEQRMDHPVCDFAKHVMQVSTRGLGVFMSDGATNVMPVGPFRAAPGKKLSPKQKKENQKVVYRAWQLSSSHIRHSLTTGFYQGWDLHPAQLIARYTTIYAFFLEGFTAASDRLRSFLDKAGQATLLGDVFDDAATGQGLLNYFLRAVNCGAISESDAEETGLTLDEIRTRSFVKILEGRKAKGSKAIAKH